MTQNERQSAPSKTGYEAENGLAEHDGSALTGDVHQAELGVGDVGMCPHCGNALNSTAVEQLLGRLRITEEMLSNLKGQCQNVDIDEYLNTAREYLKDSRDTVQRYAKENPARVAAGVAALALGASLVWSYRYLARSEELEDRFRQLELQFALAGPKYRLDEVLSELDVAV
jgi:hypothetical protein